MAFSVAGDYGGNNLTATAATLTFTGQAAVSRATGFIVAIVACDNSTTVDLSSNQVTSITTGAQNWTKVGEWTNGNAASQAGATVAMFFLRPTADLANSATSTVNFNPVSANRIVTTIRGTVSSSAQIVVSGKVAQSVDAVSMGGITISSMNAVEHLWIAAAAEEMSSGASFAEMANYTAFTRRGGGLTAATAMSARGARRILNATTDTYDPATTPADSARLYVCFTESNLGTLTSTIDSVLQHLDVLQTASIDASLIRPSAACPQGVVFDGTNDYLLRGAGLTGAADSPFVTFSFWFKRVGGDGVSQYIFAPPNVFFLIEITTTNKINIKCFSTGYVDDREFNTSNTYLSGGGWHHIVGSIDTNHASGARISQLYVDDVSDHVVGNDSAGAAFNIDLTETDCAIGATVGSSNKFNGEIADLWVAYGQYLDLSVTANRRKFIDADKRAVGLGLDGSTPTGTPPTVFLRGPSTNFPMNQGTGGVFVTTGALTESATNPPCGMFSLTASIGAILSRLITLTANLDAAVSETMFKTASADAVLLHQAITATANLDAVMQKLQTVAAQTDAILKKNQTATALIDAAMQKTQTATASIDATMQHQGIPLTAVIGALVQKTQSLVSSLDATIQHQGVLIAAQIDALMKRLDLMVIAQIDAILTAPVPSPTLIASIDALLKGDLRITAVLDALMSGSFTRTAIIDALLTGLTVVRIVARLDAIAIKEFRPGSPVLSNWTPVPATL